MLVYPKNDTPKPNFKITTLLFDRSLQSSILDVTAQPSQLKYAGVCFLGWSHPKKHTPATLKLSIYIWITMVSVLVSY